LFPAGGTCRDERIRVSGSVPIFDGMAIADQAPNDRAVRGFRPVAKVEFEALSLGLEAAVPGHGGEGAEEGEG
jgi:hypothetical protein